MDSAKVRSAVSSIVGVRSLRVELSIVKLLLRLINRDLDYLGMGVPSS